MLKIKVQKGDINRALKQFKRKFRNTQVPSPLRERQHYTKPSLKRKVEKENAIRRLKKQQDDE
jgi:small subunit ribosomal protein S21